MWRSLSGKPIEDLVASVSELLRGTREVLHVGSDSQNYGQATNYVTVVAVVDPGAGGRVFYRRKSVARTVSLAHKLFHEAELSLETAIALSQSFAHDIVVHVDVNADLRHMSSQYVRARRHGRRPRLPGARETRLVGGDARGGLAGQGQARGRGVGRGGEAPRGRRRRDGSRAERRALGRRRRDGLRADRGGAEMDAEGAEEGRRADQRGAALEVFGAAAGISTSV
jgi:predicted RNase H-related nuclease YkuK (DUF458 family)